MTIVRWVPFAKANQEKYNFLPYAGNTQLGKKMPHNMIRKMACKRPKGFVRFAAPLDQSTVSGTTRVWVEPVGFEELKVEVLDVLIDGSIVFHDVKLRTQQFLQCRPSFGRCHNGGAARIKRMQAHRLIRQMLAAHPATRIRTHRSS